MVDRIRPGRAFDVGMGRGYNAIFLVDEEWEGTGVEIAGAGPTILHYEETLGA